MNSNHNITQSIADAVKKVLLGESPEGPRSEGEKKFVDAHGIHMAEPPASDPLPGEEDSAALGTETLTKAEHPAPNVANDDDDAKTVEESTESIQDLITSEEVAELMSKCSPTSDWVREYANKVDSENASMTKEERVKMAMREYYSDKKETVTESTVGADQSFEDEYKAVVKRSDAAGDAWLKKKKILPGISSLRPGEIKLGIRNELNGKKTFYALDTDGKLIAISGTASSPKIRYVE
jgi:hypothetical protein